MDDGREGRQFEVEAQRRHKRLFVGLMIGFAVLAVVAGIALAIWVIDPLGDPKIRAPKPPPPEIHAPIHNAPAVWKDDEPAPTKSKPGLKQRLTGDDINRGMAKLRSAFNACARQHGAIDGTNVGLDFTVGPDGRVEFCSARRPHDRTPLGSCVARVVKNKGRFRKSREGLGDIHRTVVMRRPDL
ncbi:MAG: hypothetical protein JKY37_05235 [Nannocystaceae bacterium]|nr:hypothetical protein [Nannocystaceae bacterium]